jgi:hypothetical protein
VKIKLGHVEFLRAELEGRLRPDGSMRDRWDALSAAGLIPWVCSTLYPYLNDNHIDTALRAIARGNGNAED